MVANLLKIISSASHVWNAPSRLPPEQIGATSHCCFAVPPPPQVSSGPQPGNLKAPAPGRATSISSPPVSCYPLASGVGPPLQGKRPPLPWKKRTHHAPRGTPSERRPVSRQGLLSFPNWKWAASIELHERAWDLPPGRRNHVFSDSRLSTRPRTPRCRKEALFSPEEDHPYGDATPRGRIK
ncbi:hypothetical protein NDU88_003814 [Pleurodeles waltl]|uniref:Uncharacterized protein n=1 Tax=Pleurodeles waltl TaxID=8319 RepID=A0AAV7M5D5_PLEWA|nr:hypothetical protein NDU88_003814 [Pleurodeles waltl]